MADQTREFEVVDESFLQVNVSREDEEYRITAVRPEGQPASTFWAGALNLNGFAMAASSMQIGEHGERVRLERETEGSKYLNIVVESEE